MNRAVMAKEYPKSDKDAIPELFEKQAVPMPDELKAGYVKDLQEKLNRLYKPK